MEGSLDPSLTAELLYARFTRALNECDIDEFGILPFVPEEETTLPEWHPFLVDNDRTKFGIPMACWAPLIGAAYDLLKPIVNGAFQPWWKDFEKCQQVVESTRCLMALCPDSYIAMNARKRLVKEGVLDPLSELEYLDIVLTITRNCKSAGVWHHRKWLLYYMHPLMDKEPLDIAVIERHLAACHLAAELYPKCYYAWTTRHWLVDQLARAYNIPSRSSSFFAATQADSSSDTGTNDEDQLDPAQWSMRAEWQRMVEHVERNVSDYSSFQHFQHVLLKLSGRYIVNEYRPTIAWRTAEAREKAEGQEASSTNSRPVCMSGNANLPNTQERISSVTLCWDRKTFHARRRACGPGRMRVVATRLQQRHESPHTPQSRHQGAEQQRERATGATLDEEKEYMMALRQEQFVHMLWQGEADRVRRLIESFPGHETLWYHLRFVFYGLCWLDSGGEFPDGESFATTTTASAAATTSTASTAAEQVSPATERLFVQRILGVNVEEEGEKMDTLKEGINITHARNDNVAQDINVLDEALEAQLGCVKRYLAWIDHLLEPQE